MLIFSASSEEEEEVKPQPKKQMNLKFRNKKEAMDAFKALLKEKVSWLLKTSSVFNIFMLFRCGI